MTPEDILKKYRHQRRGQMQTGTIWRAMEEYAKYHAELAFEAGMDIVKKWETDLPVEAIPKEEYIQKTFPNA